MRTFITGPFIIDKEPQTYGSDSTVGKELKELFPGMKEIVIPRRIVRIENEAFAGCTELRKVTFPTTIRSIGLCRLYGTRAGCCSRRNL